MRRFVILTALAALIVAPVAGAAEVAWMEGSFDQVLARAADEKKPILVDFYTVWCGPCKKLDREVWVDPRIAELTGEGFVAAKVDCEKGEGIDLSRAHKVFAYPNVVVLNPDGTELDRVIGYRDPDAMLAFLSDMRAGRNTTDQLMAATPATSSDPEALYRVGDRLTAMARKDEAEPYLRRAVELDPRNEAGVGAPALLDLADLERKVEDFPAAIGVVERVLREFADDAIQDEALSRLAYYNRKMKNMEGAADAYRRMMARHPEDPGTLNAFAWFAATNGVALEEATEVARKAVRLSKEKPGLLDTLAECYYARGMIDEAVATIDRAIAQEPDDSYYRDQRSKFEAARTGSE